MRSYYVLLEVGTENQAEAAEVAREAADDGRVSSVKLFRAEPIEDHEMEGAA